MPDIDLRLGDFFEVLHNLQADLVFTSPPYNIGSKAKRHDGYRKDGAYDPKSFGGVDGYADTIPEADYQDIQRCFLCWCADNTTKNAVIVYNHKPRRRNKTIIDPLQWILKVDALVVADQIVWDRGSTHNHDKTMFYSQTERLYVLEHPELEPDETEEDEGSERLYAMRKPKGIYPLRNVKDSKLLQKSDIWKIDREMQKYGHCAPFPLELAITVIQAYSQVGDLVLDPYSGSGTTAVACKLTGRRFIGAEILEKYWDIAMARLAATAAPTAAELHNLDYKQLVQRTRVNQRPKKSEQPAVQVPSHDQDQDGAELYADQQ